MTNYLFKLQMFADGGDGSGTGTVGSEIGSSETAENGFANRKSKSDLGNVIYGKASEGNEIESSNTISKESKSKAFEDLIKGEYKEEFTKRTQGIINERFKATKGMEETLKSHDEILRMLSDKYGVKDASDIKALTKALTEDESFYEQEAMEKGLTVEQLKDMKRLERENEAFKKAEQERLVEEKGKQQYANWLKESEEFSQRYGISDFNFNAEVESNPEFAELIFKGLSVESAYKALHFDDMMGGAMAQTAHTIKEQLAKNVSARNARPSENGVSTQTSAIFKTDVNKLTKADRDEIDRRVARGEIISF